MDGFANTLTLLDHAGLTPVNDHLFLHYLLDHALDGRHEGLCIAVDGDFPAAMPQS
jgi:hypothetical protein